jgi:hypothetical protein
MNSDSDDSGDGMSFFSHSEFGFAGFADAQENHLADTKSIMNVSLIKNHCFPNS